MRTHIYNKCTNDEIESYLQTPDPTLIIAVGTVELHGQLPVDCETILAEAAAVKMAEQADALAVINLPYFCAGSTAIGRSTVNISVATGVAYLKEVVHSFYRQGFRRMMLVSCHGPAYLTLNTVCMDFFHETRDPIIHCDLGHAMQIAADNGWEQKDFMGNFVDLLYGAYQTMGQLDYIPVLPDVDMEALQKERAFGNEKQKLKQELHRLAPSPGLFGSYYYTKAQHGGGEQSLSEEERKERGERGERLLTEMIRWFDPKKYLDLLKELDVQVNEEILPLYPHLQKGA